MSGRGKLQLIALSITPLAQTDFIASDALGNCSGHPVFTGRRSPLNQIKRRTWVNIARLFTNTENKRGSHRRLSNPLSLDFLAKKSGTAAIVASRVPNVTWRHVVRQSRHSGGARSHNDTRSCSPILAADFPKLPQQRTHSAPLKGGSKVLTRAQEDDHWLPQRKIAITPRRSERSCSSENVGDHMSTMISTSPRGSIAARGGFVLAVPGGN